MKIERLFTGHRIIVLALVLLVGFVAGVVLHWKPSAADRSGDMFFGDVLHPQRATALKAPNTPAKTANSATPTPNWRLRFRQAPTAYDFVRDALPSALAGDGRAAELIGEAMHYCGVFVLSNESSQSALEDINHRLEILQSSPTAVTLDIPGVESTLRERYKSCNGFLANDLFTGLPGSKSQHYISEYWDDMAYKYGDHVAIAHHAVRVVQDAMASITPGDPAGPRVTDNTLSSITNVVKSLDPDAIMALGDAYSGGSNLQVFPHQDVVIALAACALGYDCNSASVPGSFGCLHGQVCDGLTDIQRMQSMINDDRVFARLFQQGQELAGYIQQGDEEALRPFFAFNAAQRTKAGNTNGASPP